MHRTATILFLATTLAAVSSGVAADDPTEESLVRQITETLPSMPRHDVRSLESAMVLLFYDADRAKLERLAAHPDWSIGMYARWEMRDSLFDRTFDPQNPYYPVRFLELKGIDVPPAWAAVFAARFMPSRALRRHTAEYYREHKDLPSQMAFMRGDPATYIHCANADIPTGTTVDETDKELVVTQGDMTVRLKKPLTGNFYGLLAGWSLSDVFLPLLTKDMTYVLYSRSTGMASFALVCFDSASGSRKWESIGWSASPDSVRVVPWNLLSPGYRSILPSMIVGKRVTPGQDGPATAGAARLDTRQWGASSVYLVADGPLVTVFGESAGVLFVEAFDVPSGRNVLRFATEYHAGRPDLPEEEFEAGPGGLIIPERLGL